MINKLLKLFDVETTGTGGGVGEDICLLPLTLFFPGPGLELVGLRFCLYSISTGSSYPLLDPSRAVPPSPSVSCELMR